MKKIQISYIAALILGMGALSSCQEDFLEVDPRATQIESNYFKNAAEVFNGLVAAYDPLGWEGDVASGYANFACLVAASDEAYGGGGSSSDVWYLQTMNNFNLLDPANGPQLGFWQRNFTGVSRVNTIISKLEGNISGLDEGTKKRYIAEAKALRAYYYFDLVRLFRNVPLIITPLSTDEIYQVEQAAPEAVYTQIEKDLQEAIAEVNLPNTVPAATEGGRITKGAAQALLGKVYIYEKKWKEAVQQLAEVNGTPGGTSKYGYRLLPNFADIFRPDNQFHSESILEIGHTAIAASNWGNTSKVEGLIASTMFGPRSYNGPLYYSTWGGCPITPELYNALYHDPRFKATIADVDSLVRIGKATYVPGYMNTGHFVQKYAPLQSFKSTGAGAATLNYPQNYIEMRLADTYLMEAEALVEGGGDMARAAALLNAVRARVGLKPVAATLDNIHQERRLELATEGHRWYDLVRTGKAATVLAPMGFEAGKNEILPIPLPELNNTKLVQNPKY
ncbi:membrane protein [Adhaeribacter aerolatus]|uniref:Membrane protein n=1 Tax=Adhaeribacter aerolatus TaxID=670289 RepID=A0A512B566_9BACT|nr:RagB/SusD family nutrient uptake outer membrane protein [Adhaeribacter aerolatus]GEO07100.1 membrane protein [Adhaeribacter aerolatus]